MYTVSIQDNGIGIEEKYFDQIFVMFNRLHDRESYSASGLGLSICKKVINKMGGTIQVESELGKGSTFTFNVLVANDSYKADC